MLACGNGLRMGTRSFESIHKSAKAASRICVASCSKGPTSKIFKRQSHIGSAPLYLSSSIKLNVEPFPPMVNPTKRQPIQFQNGEVYSITVEGPLGAVIIPMRKFITLNWHEGENSTQVNDQKLPSEGEEAEQQRKLTLGIKDQSIKIQRGTWGLTRALLANAIEGVQEGHSISIRLVGVGYRATVEEDPFPLPDKFEVAFAKLENEIPSPEKLGTKKKFNGLGNFFSEKQIEYYRNVILGSSQKAVAKKQRLSLRLGYSHPIFMPIPRGIICTTPQPTMIVLKGVDKESLGQFAANIRKWRPPEPYKGKGVFIGDETIKLKAARKK